MPTRPREDNIDTPLAQRIRLLGYTVTEVSQGTGIDRFYLNDYMYGRKRIIPRDVGRLCAFLKCEPETIT